MTSTPNTPTPSRHQNGFGDYTFYDENYRPMWNRGISRKIGESAFVQQTLPTYRLKWSPYALCPCLLLMGALFTGMGVGIKKFSDNIQEIIIPYTDCMSEEDPGKTCAEIIKTSEYHHLDALDIENCTCRVKFELKEPLNGTIYMYYTLSDFFQNHKNYYLSRDENQLKGKLFDKDGQPKEPSKACGKHWDYVGGKLEEGGKIIYPCGLMANSMFTDVIDLYYYPEDGYADIEFIKQNVKRSGIASNLYNHEELNHRIELKVPLNRTGIAWEAHKDEKYENPEDFFNANHSRWLNFVKPRRWKKSLWELDLESENFTNNGVENEDFIVWMKTAAFPWFRKLYRIVSSNFHPFEKGLPQGNYSLKIQYNYDVSSFRGEKQILLTTSNMVAGKNMFLAIVYMGTGVLCMFISIVLFIAHKCSWASVEESLKED